MTTTKYRTIHAKAVAGLAVCAVLALPGTAISAPCDDRDLKELSAETKFALTNVFEGLVKYDIDDPRARRQRIAEAHRHPDFRQAMEWRDQFDVAGADILTKKKNPMVAEITKEIGGYRFEDRCAGIHVVQLMHAYYQALDYCFTKNGDKLIRLIARAMGDLYAGLADFEELAKGSRDQIAKHDGELDEKWENMLKGEAKIYEEYCQPEESG